MINTITYKFFETNLLNNHRSELDFIFANLPYIPSLRITNLNPSVKDYEPHIALDGGREGLKYKYQGINRIVVYPNDRSIQLRKELASNYGIKGIAYWRLGDDTNLKL